MTVKHFTYALFQVSEEHYEVDTVATNKETETWEDK